MKRIPVITLGVWVALTIIGLGQCEIECAWNAPAADNSARAATKNSGDHSRHAAHHLPAHQNSHPGSEGSHRACLAVFHPQRWTDLRALAGFALSHSALPATAVYAISPGPVELFFKLSSGWDPHLQTLWLIPLRI